MRRGTDGRNALRNAQANPGQPGQQPQPETPAVVEPARPRQKVTLIQGSRAKAREFVTDRNVVLRLDEGSTLNPMTEPLPVSWLPLDLRNRGWPSAVLGFGDPAVGTEFADRPRPS